MVYHELRTYRLHSPRLMAHMHDRMAQHMVPLFHEHGIRPVGSWEMVVGREMATFFYMLEFDSLAHREAGFASFYADPRVREMTDATIERAGSEFVRDYDITWLQHADYLAPGGEPAIAGPTPWHELRTLRLRSPRLMPNMHERFREHIAPLFREHGIRTLGAWEVVAGRDMPAFLYLAGFESLGHREQAFASFYGDPRVGEMIDATIERAGTEFLRDFDIALLRHADYLPFGGHPTAPATTTTTEGDL